MNPETPELGGFLRTTEKPYQYLYYSGNQGLYLTDSKELEHEDVNTTITPQQGLLYAGGIAEGDSIEWWTQVTEVPGDSAFSMGYFDPIFYFPVWNDVYLVEAINSYGCSTFSAPFLVDMTIGIADLSEAPLRLWLDPQRQLHSNVPLAGVTWFDALGRPLLLPSGCGPWVVHATTADGRLVRRLMAQP